MGVCGREQERWADVFRNPKQYIALKMKMLRLDMYIEPTLDEITHLQKLKTEQAIDSAVHSIIDRHWSTD